MSKPSQHIIANYYIVRRRTGWTTKKNANGICVLCKWQFGWIIERKPSCVYLPFTLIFSFIRYRLIGLYSRYVFAERQCEPEWDAVATDENVFFCQRFFGFDAVNCWPKKTRCNELCRAHNLQFLAVLVALKYKSIWSPSVDVVNINTRTHVCRSIHSSVRMPNICIHDTMNKWKSNRFWVCFVSQFEEHWTPQRRRSHCI